MNRAERRAAAHAKSHPQCKVVALSRVFDQFAVFDGIERILAKISSGEVDFANGAPIFQAVDGGWFESVPALQGWISAWKRFNTKFDLNHDVGALERLCNALYYGMTIPRVLLDAANKVIAEERRLFKNIPRDELASAAKTEQIALLMEDVA